MASSFSPLGFAREYQTYRAENAAVPFLDSRLLAASRFWSRHTQILSSDSYSTFWREDLPPLLRADGSQFEDLHPNELSEIAAFIASLDSARIESELSAASLWELAAKKWFYVGHTDQALKSLALALNPHSAFRIPDSDVGWAQPTLRTPAEAHAIPRLMIEQLGEGESAAADEPALVNWFTRFDAEWRATRESGIANQAVCVLVERDAAGRPVRGRLRTLEAYVEPLPKDRDTDEVVFGHQLRTADDPQVRGAYAAVACLRQIASNAEFGMRNSESNNSSFPRKRESSPLAAKMDSRLSKIPSGVEGRGNDGTSHSSIPHSAFRIPHLRAQFTFSNAAHEPHTGASLAFACLVAGYGDWWSKDLHRERRLVSTNLALTGTLDANGAAEAVSESSLPKKIERVFFSPLASLAVPKSNRENAEAEVKRLQTQHPNRRLSILTADRASDLVSDGNILIPERVCLGEYAVRAAAKYSRSLKVQVPILILLLFIAGWIGLPALRAVLDRNPITIAHTQYGFDALNKYEHRIWSKRYSLPVVKLPPCVVYDLDGDRKNEVLYFVGHDKPSPDNAKIDVFDSEGSLRFRLDPVILGQYAGDYEPKEPYAPGSLTVVEVHGQPIIVTGANAQNPSRFHLKIWSAQGDSLGWYVNAGVVEPHALVMDIDLDGTEELVFPGLNVRMRARVLFALKVHGSYGVSPPYSDEQYDLSRVQPGNQLHYMYFPVTDLTLIMAQGLYNADGGIHEISTSGFRYDVLEGMDKPEEDKGLNWAVDYYIDSTLHVARVDVDDSYKVRREALVRADSLPAIPWPEYFEMLQDTVMYWSADGWVSDKALGQPGDIGRLGRIQ